MKALALAVLLFTPGQAQATGLDCRFTTICSPLTDCQDHAGVPFRFDVTDGGLSFVSDGRTILGTPLSNVAPPAMALVFDTAPDATILLSVTASGQAVMTQQDILAGDTIQSVSFFGICEPAA
ncbi:hypothetical protein [Hasllibacter sp. MH4015]|uniref:hypothetical protein n=1 Tax=Hasllibacter sp. MH4015 TaxID=2854029 RepID=UPI001CD2113C|nr:hypothetical protein [Hasllibacter sp. MH4015]